MKKIIEMGKDKGMDSGVALYGDYTVGGMEGSNHYNYLETSGLVGGWFMPFVYTSKHINAKNIYFYHSLATYRFETKELTVSGFELPAEAVIKLGLVVFEGDPGLAMTTKIDKDTNQVIIPYQKAEPEGLYISGQSDPDNFAPMFNNCNPPKTITDTYSSSGGWGALDYTEMFNSISSVFGWEDTSNYWCVGNPNQLWPIDETNPLEYAIDADILMVDAGYNGPFYGKFNKGDTSFNIKIGANQDQVYTNMLIISVDTQRHGEFGGECYPDGTCNEGLKCDIEHNICVEPETDNTDTATDTDSADTATDTDSADTADQADSDSDTSDSGSDTSDSSTEKGNTGELNGECYPNGTCNEGLTCSKDNICTKPLVLKKSGGCSILTVD